MDYIFLLLGFILLIKGADIFVDGASNISKKIGIPSIIVGLTIVSLGTSAPELAVSLLSSLKGSNDMAVGNVLGSNIFNILVVLGSTIVISPLTLSKKDVKRDYMFTLLTLLTLMLIAFTSLFDGKLNIISRFDGAILVAICVFYTTLLVLATLKDKKVLKDNVDEIKNIKILPNIFKIIVGVAGIAVGGNFVVDSASAIALSFGMSEKLVGLTIVAVGTSLPELVTSIVAARKGETEIALGNVLGSCIFNIILILGVAAVISPIAVTFSLLADFSLLAFVVLLLGVFIFMGKKEETTLPKIFGAFFISLYISYVIFIITRN